MENLNEAFDDFIDDCFIGSDPICNQELDPSLEIVASQLISEVISADDAYFAA